MFTDLFWGMASIRGVSRDQVGLDPLGLKLLALDTLMETVSWWLQWSQLGSSYTMGGIHADRSPAN